MGVALNRVVAVVATFSNGLQQIGSGYLVETDKVLTAGHCTRHKVTGELAQSVKVIRATDGAESSVKNIVASTKLDVAVIKLQEPFQGEPLSPVIFAQVNRFETGILENCEGVGFPIFQRDENNNPRTSEVHGVIYQTDGADVGQLVMREPLIHPGPTMIREAPMSDASSATAKSAADASGSGSPWGGLSGTVLFYEGKAIGVVVKHYPWQGDSALRAVEFKEMTRGAKADLPTRDVTDALGIHGPLELVEVAGERVEPLTGLVDQLNAAGDDLPQIQDLDPYQLGATPTNYGGTSTSSGHDPYVPRTANSVDDHLREALVPGCLVVVVGASKAGKTRTTFEALQGQWNHARLLAPSRHELSAAIKHPRVQRTTDPLVVWLDDLHDYITPADPFTPASLTALRARKGHTLVVGTLRSEERARLNQEGELTRETRRLLEEATQIELAPTSEDATEQVAAQASYPDEDFSEYGIGEQLSGARTLLNQYRDARYGDPILHAIIQSAIDWVRIGISDPIPEEYLIEMAHASSRTTHPEIDATSKKIVKKIKKARMPPVGAGRVAALHTEVVNNRERQYWPFAYLVAADDGQLGSPRSIPDAFWDYALGYVDAETAFDMSISAYYRNNIEVAISCLHKSAKAGNPIAMYNLGHMLGKELDPPDLKAARYWYEQAANAGEPKAMLVLGALLATMIDPPDVVGAKIWYEKAAAAGEAKAMFNLAHLLETQTNPPDMIGARNWYEEAANAGEPRAMVSLARLLVTQVDPPDGVGARDWYEKAAAAGHTEAMLVIGTMSLGDPDPFELEGQAWWQRAGSAGHADTMNNLGNFLLDQIDPPDVAGARDWYEKASTFGHLEAMNNLGYLLASRVQPPDLEGACAAWQGAVDTPVSNEVDREQQGLAALSLASLEAFLGSKNHAVELLDLAVQQGIDQAANCQEILVSCSDNSKNAIQDWQGAQDNSDILNFIGISYYLKGKIESARKMWSKSEKLGDVVAPLLLHLSKYNRNF